MVAELSAHPGDLVICLGAGTITDLGQRSCPAKLTALHRGVAGAGKC